MKFVKIEISVYIFIVLYKVFLYVHVEMWNFKNKTYALFDEVSPNNH